MTLSVITDRVPKIAQGGGEVVSNTEREVEEYVRVGSSSPVRRPVEYVSDRVRCARPTNRIRVAASSHGGPETPHLR